MSGSSFLWKNSRAFAVQTARLKRSDSHFDAMLQSNLQPFAEHRQRSTVWAVPLQATFNQRSCCCPSPPPAPRRFPCSSSRVSIIAREKLFGFPRVSFLLNLPSAVALNSVRLLDHETFMKSQIRRSPQCAAHMENKHISYHTRHQRKMEIRQFLQQRGHSEGAMPPPRAKQVQ